MHSGMGCHMHRGVGVICIVEWGVICIVEQDVIIFSNLQIHQEKNHPIINTCVARVLP